MSFVAIEAEASASQLELEVYEGLEAQFAGWSPAEGDLTVWLTKAFTRIGGSIFDMAALMSKEAFKKFGETIVGVPPILAAPAVGESIWTMIDKAGYTIPAGSQVAIEASGESSLGFATIEDVTVAPEATTATVTLRAVEAGTEGNGLSADPTLIDALAYVESIALEGVTSGGVDEEEEDAYLDRLVESLQLLSLSLIVPHDFEIDARAVAGVARALCIPGYKWSTKEEGKPLTLTVFVVDASGTKLGATAKEELTARQAAKVPSGVTNYVGDPTVTEIDVTTEVTAQEGFDTATVKAAVEARLTEYLSPANWGIPTLGESPGGWNNTTTLYRNELISEVDRVTGVGRVVVLKLAKGGAELKESDVALTAPAPLTTPKTLTVTVK